MNIRAWWVVAMMVGMVACDQTGTPSTPREPVAMPSDQQIQIRWLRGEVTYRERMALPDGSRLQVHLLAPAGVGEEGRLLAQTLLPVTGQVPLEFSLQYDPRLVRQAQAHGPVRLVASLLDESGQILFANREDVVLDLDTADQPMQVLLARVTDADESGDYSVVWDNPWSRARERGVTFRAVGNEPGWTVELFGRRHLEVLLDYGETTLELDDFQLEDREDHIRLVAELEQGTLEVVGERAYCADTMVEATYPWQVTVTLGERIYQGCGNRL